MTRTQPLACRRGHAIRWLAAALSGLAVAISAGTQVQAASAAALTKPAPIKLNTANWSGNAGFGSRGPAWYTDGSGVVHLQGAAHQISTSGFGPNVIGTLPPAARPALAVFTVVPTFAGT
jgi:hypothetical protein